MSGASDDATDLEVFIDYHCPYSDRVVDWLAAVGPTYARPRYRLFGLEQVNRDPSAIVWRLWEQPLDYEHYKGLPHRRPLQAFLVTALLEAIAPPVVGRFRTLVFRARFDAGADISDLGLLGRLAIEAGADRAELERGLMDPRADAAARARIAADWADARGEWAIFGVPTLRLPDRPPFYLRLEAPVPPDEALAAWQRILDLRRTIPALVEIKQPDRVADGPDNPSHDEQPAGSRRP